MTASDTHNPETCDGEDAAALDDAEIDARSPDVLRAFASHEGTGWSDRFNSCYADHYGELLRVAGRILGRDRVAAEDCVQSAFLAVWIARDRYVLGDPLLPLMRVAVRNAALDQRKRAEAVWKDRAARALPDRERTVASIEERLALESDFLAVLFRMPAQQRSAFVHVQIYECTIPEASARMRVAEKTVRNNLALARGRLQTALGSLLGAGRASNRTLRDR